MTYEDKSGLGVDGAFGCSLRDACRKCKSCSDICKSMDVSRKLQDAGMRITRQRVELAQLLFGNGDRHFTADALYDEAMGSKIPVSLATVYNTLQQFVSAGLIRKLGIEGQKAWYDTNISEHHHLFFEDENIIDDIDNSAISIAKLPAVPDGMVISRVEIVVRLKRQEI